ncbi:unnamed protein product [Paramecium octaurelia]|uniref:Uncharacterized protein n=1 Tax=Paramecium octaurelia TaxID=43137 RepID=A0A8S1U0T0_PAROT|nr:unnamed protein product [Paramecium octaurelia]
MQSSQQNKYGFEENFNGSSVSEESQDIIIVEPLDEQKQAINKANALYLTGQNQSVQGSSYSNKQTNQSAIPSRIYSQTNQSNQPEHKPYFQQSQRPVYDPTASVPRKYDPNLIQRTQQQQPPLKSNANQQILPTMEPQPRITQTVVKQTEKQFHQPNNYDNYQRDRNFQEQFEVSDDEDVFQIQDQQKSSQKQPSVADLPIERKIANSITPSDKKPIQIQQSAQMRESKAPVLTEKDKQQLIANAKQQMLTLDLLASKLSTQNYTGQDICEIVSIQKGIIKLSQDLNNILSQDRNSIVLVGIIGQNKSGKSTLLNEIAHTSNKQKFGNNGIWMLSKPLIIEQKSYYFIDCQSTDNQLLYALVMLSCSTLLYNTLKLDDNSIQCFPVLDTIFRLLINEYALMQLLPNFIWVQRDALQARPIIELQEFLVKANKGQQFENLIKQRDVACIAPQGTSEYQNSISQLKDRIILGSVCKQVNSYNLNGPLMYLYMEQIVDLLNKPIALQLDQLWLSICEDYTKAIYNQSLNSFVQQVDNWMKDNQKVDEIEIYKQFRDFKDVSLQQIFPTCFLNNKNRSYQQYKKKLQEIIASKEKQALQYCLYTSQCENDALMTKNISKMNFKDIDSFSQSFSSMIDQLLKQKYQFQQCSAFAECLQKNYKKLIEELFSKYQKQQANSSEEQQYNLQQSKIQVSNKEDELKKKQEQVTFLEKKRSLLIKEIEGLQDQIKLERDSIAPDARQSQQGPNDDQLLELKQTCAQNKQEIQVLRKQVQDAERRKNEEGCNIQ